jgi:hypothetical protein
VVADVDLTGKRAVVTGSWAGIGAETARVLAGASAEGVLAVRRSAAGEEAAAQISAQTGNPRVSTRTLDLAHLPGMCRCTSCNAGIVAVSERELPPQGHELQLHGRSPAPVAGRWVCATVSVSTSHGLSRVSGTQTSRPTVTRHTRLPSMRRRQCLQIWTAALGTWSGASPRAYEILLPPFNIPDRTGNISASR